LAEEESDDEDETLTDYAEEDRDDEDEENDVLAQDSWVSDEPGNPVVSTRIHVLYRNGVPSYTIVIRRDPRGSVQELDPQTKMQQESIRKIQAMIRGHLLRKRMDVRVGLTLASSESFRSRWMHVL
jgi:hypothetical protein